MSLETTEKICVKWQHVDNNGCPFSFFELRCKNNFYLFSVLFFLRGKWILQQCLSKNIAKHNSNFFGKCSDCTFIMFNRLSHIF